MSQTEIHKYDKGLATTETVQPGIANGMAEMLHKARNQRVVSVNLDDDPEVLARVKHTMKPGETLGTWYSRVLMGRAAVLESSPEEISRFVAQAMANLEDSGTEIYSPRPITPRRKSNYK